MRKELVYLKSTINRINKYEVINIVPIDCYSNFYLYADFDSVLHCFSIKDKRFGSIDVKKSMVDKEEKKYMEIARKYNKKDRKKPVDTDEIVLMTANS